MSNAQYQQYNLIPQPGGLTPQTARLPYPAPPPIPQPTQPATTPQTVRLPYQQVPQGELPPQQTQPGGITATQQPVRPPYPITQPRPIAQQTQPPSFNYGTQRPNPYSVLAPPKPIPGPYTQQFPLVPGQGFLPYGGFRTAEQLKTRKTIMITLIVMGVIAVLIGTYLGIAYWQKIWPFNDGGGGGGGGGGGDKKKEDDGKTPCVAPSPNQILSSSAPIFPKTYIRSYKLVQDNKRVIVYVCMQDPSVFHWYYYLNPGALSQLTIEGQDNTTFKVISNGQGQNANMLGVLLDPAPKGDITGKQLFAPSMTRAPPSWVVLDFNQGSETNLPWIKIYGSRAFNAQYWGGSNNPQIFIGNNPSSNLYTAQFGDSDDDNTLIYLQGNRTNFGLVKRGDIANVGLIRPSGI